MVTRLSLGRSNTRVGTALPPAVGGHALLFQDDSNTTTWYQVETNWGMALSDTTWRHDEELGRGYLLASDRHGAGRIWRWEVGGAPLVVVGSTLHMEAAGCRSRKQCTEGGEERGSSALAVEPQTQALVVAEIGEQRIVRVESTTGARTPLWLTPCTVSRMAYSSQGDLFFVASVSSSSSNTSSAVCGARMGLYHLPQAFHVPALDSLPESRKAHEWTVLPNNYTTWRLAADAVGGPESSWIGGLAVDGASSTLYYSSLLAETGEVVLMQVQLERDDLDEDDEEDNDFQLKATVHTHLAAGGVPGAVALTNQGSILVVVDDSIQIIPQKENGATVSTISLPMETPVTSLTLGGDGFLYATSAAHLYRTRMAKGVGPVELPDRIPKKPKLTA